MLGNIQLRLLLFMLWIPVLLPAQQPTITSQDMEDLLYRSESAIIPETLLNEYVEPGAPPIDLNSTSPEELEASGLFTPFQLYNLLKYLEKYGEVYSMYELVALPGFHRSKVLEIEPFVTLEHSNIHTGKKPLRHMVLIDVGKTFPNSKGYQQDSGSGNESNYAGSPLKATIRIRSHLWKNLALGLTYEKDAGEQFLYRNKLQFLSGYLSYNGDRTIRHLVVGNFQLNQGVGLVNGAGFIHRAGNFHVNRQSLSQIRPYASKTETMFEQGIACQLELNNIQLLMWASYRQLSLSPSAFTENPKADKWLDYQRSSGLYRTVGELEGRELAYRIHTGIQALYKHRQLAVGIMSGTEWIYPTKKAMKYLTTNPGPARHQKASLHGNWQKRQIQVFGELSFGGYRSLACLLGTEYYFSDFVQGSLLMHHYGTEYRGSYPSSYGSGSTIENEQGVAFHLHVETGKYVTAELTGELFRYLSPRYLTTVPSSGNRLDLSLQNPVKKLFQWRLRVVSKTWQTTPATETTKLRPLQNSRVTRIDGRLIYNYQDLFKWQTRLVISYYSQQLEEVPGFAAVQQITLCTFRNLKATVQFVLFQITDWENRIYLYEPAVYYSFSFPAYYGSGQKTTLLLTLKPVQRITFSAKISGITNSGNQKWEAAIQLRMNL